METRNSERHEARVTNAQTHGNVCAPGHSFHKQFQCCASPSPALCHSQCCPVPLPALLCASPSPVHFPVLCLSQPCAWPFWWLYPVSMAFGPRRVFPALGSLLFPPASLLHAPTCFPKSYRSVFSPYYLWHQKKAGTKSQKTG